MSLGSLTSLVLLAAAALLALLAIHPYVTYPLSLRLLARFRRRPIHRGTAFGKVAICVCAYNEERVIADKIRNLIDMRQAVPNLDILLYVDAASDGTAEIVTELAEDIRVVFSPTRSGKSHGMNLLVTMTDADYIVFTDANVTFSQDALPRLLAPFADPEVGCVCGHLIYTGDRAAATAATGSFYWRLEEQIKELESACGSVMGADGSIFAIRRALHRPPPPDLIDDMFVSLSVLSAGARIVRAGDAIAYEEAVSRPAEEFRRKIRIACQAFNVHRALRGDLRRLSFLDTYKYVSHKLVRWLTIYLLGGSALCLLAGLATASGWFALLLGIGAASVCALVLALSRSGPLAKVRDILAAFVATGIGVWRSLQGDRFQTWNPPSSARGASPHGSVLPS
ncbi:MAG: glycosyltransferase [Alphaproteobacteria bacterium]|nr:glycosyltransferase [Alphaproteobacteria bacterium]